MHFITRECFGCGAALPGEPGVHYCDACVAHQQAEAKAEREAFEVFHRYADECAKRSR